MGRLGGVRTPLPFFRGCANTFTLSALCENRVNDEICEAHAATTPLFDTVSGLLRTGDACTVALTDVAAHRAAEHVVCACPTLVTPS